MPGRTSTIRRARSGAAQLGRRALVIRHWVRAPRQAIADVAAAKAAVRGVRGGDTSPGAHELTQLAARMTELGRYRLAVPLLDAAIVGRGPTAEMLRMRRRTPGFTGSVPPAILERAAQRARESGPPARHRRVIGRQTLLGKGFDVEVVVRHAVGGSRTMVRKTFRGEEPVEVRLYASGLLTDPGSWWRAPQLYHLERDGTDRWHLFVEDLGRVRRLDNGVDVVRAARALGELAGSHPADAASVADLPWLVRQREWPRVLEPGPAAKRLAASSIDPDVAEMVVSTLQRLRRGRRSLEAAVDSLPASLCHGDATLGNVVLRDGRAVLFDWAGSRIAPLGSDLGCLLGLSNRVVRRTPSLVDDAVNAYMSGLRAGGPVAVSAEDVWIGYRYRFVRQALRWQLLRLPERSPRAGPLGVARLAVSPSAPRRSSVEANLRRAGVEAEALAAAVGLAR